MRADQRRLLVPPAPALRKKVAAVLGSDGQMPPTSLTSQAMKRRYGKTAARAKTIRFCRTGDCYFPAGAPQRKDPCLQKWSHGRVAAFQPSGLWQGSSPVATPALRPTVLGTSSPQSLG